MLCDGRMVCGCADPYGKRVLGDARASSVHDVWTGPVVSQLREDLNAGGSTFCGDCPLKLPLEEGRGAAGPADRRRPAALADVHRVHGGVQHLVRGGRAARRRPASRARGRPACSTSICSAASSTRRARRSAGSTSSTTARRSSTSAPSRCASTSRRSFPHIYLYTSTNGLAFERSAGAPARALRHRRSDLLDRRRDAGELREIPPARDGSTSRSRTCARWPTRSGRTGRDLPFLNWRYILFVWNDSDEEMNLARQLAADIGVDRLCWEITDHPEDAYSRRFVPGSPRARVHPPRNLGRQQPRQRDSRRDAARAHRRAHAGAGRAAPGARRTPLHVRTRVHNLSTRPFPAPGHLRPPPGAARRAAVRRRRHAHQPRLRAGLAAPDAGARRPRGRGHRAFPVPPKPGTLRAEIRSGERGIDWFERCGSDDDHQTARGAVPRERRPTFSRRKSSTFRITCGHRYSCST